jgi:hypothetical protein
MKNDKYDEALELSQSMEPSSHNNLKKLDNKPVIDAKSFSKSENYTNKPHDEAHDLSHSHSSEGSVDTPIRKGPTPFSMKPQSITTNSNSPSIDAASKANNVIDYGLLY